ncbi:hypothetical protein Leryth_024563 [Lithospermum erythrorhizon]|nr:hypothetical protein Leryth_024563 [Lithospermum erythrorhizon]
MKVLLGKCRIIHLPRRKPKEGASIHHHRLKVLSRRAGYPSHGSQAQLLWWIGDKSKRLILAPCLEMLLPADQACFESRYRSVPDKSKYSWSEFAQSHFFTSYLP